ncbi:hypothetical protein D3C86_1221180 [compost metagenome]
MGVGGLQGDLVARDAADVAVGARPERGMSRCRLAGVVGERVIRLDPVALDGREVRHLAGGHQLFEEALAATVQGDEHDLGGIGGARRDGARERQGDGGKGDKGDATAHEGPPGGCVAILALPCRLK